MSALILKIFKIKFLILWVLSFQGVTFAQYGFQKVYNQQQIDTISIISDVYLLNDSIYFSGGGGSGNTTGIRFAKVSDEGIIEDLARYDIPDHKIRAYYSNVDTDTNFRGNLVNVYNSYDLGLERHGYRLVEYDMDGTVIFDSLYETFDSDSVRIFDGSNLIHFKSDSAYLCLLNYVDNKENGTSNVSSGSMLVKIKYDGTVIWRKRFYTTAYNNSVFTSGWSIDHREGGGLNLHYVELMNGPVSLDESWSKQHFAVLDDAGNVVSDKVFQDGDYCYTFSEAFFEGDTIYLQYFDSKLENEGQNNVYQLAKPILAKIGPDMQIIWKKELHDFWGTYPSLRASMKRIRKINDSTFAGATGHANKIKDSTSAAIGTYTSRIYNFTSDGDYNWIRDHYYYPIDSVKDPTYEINDIEIMSDGGFVLGGVSILRDSTNQGKPGQFAYLLRTNCLGFLSPPQAQYSYESDKNEVLFVNHSMNSGGYTWYFGDGDSLRTGEDQDSVYHTYEYEGEYEVTLIAHGCNSEADTAKLSINVEEGAYGNIGDELFTIYPNPILTGNLITVESGTVENASLQFFDAQGRKVKAVEIPQAKSIYFIEQEFSSGTYSVLLIKDGEVLQDEKVVVQ
jgi:PKD repeat protein